MWQGAFASKFGFRLWIILPFSQLSQSTNNIACIYCKGYFINWIPLCMRGPKLKLHLDSGGRSAMKLRERTLRILLSRSSVLLVDFCTHRERQLLRAVFAAARPRLAVPHDGLQHLGERLFAVHLQPAAAGSDNQTIFLLT